MLAVFATVIATPPVCLAHSVHPVYFGLGPFVFVVPVSQFAPWSATVVHVITISIVIVIQAVVLRLAVRHRAAFGNLWRAGVAFVASKVAESVAAIALFLIGPWLAPGLAWRPDSWETVFVLPVLMLAAGVAANAAFVWAFFRKERPSKTRIWLTAVLLSGIAFVALLLSTLGMIQMRWL